MTRRILLISAGFICCALASMLACEPRPPMVYSLEFEPVDANHTMISCEKPLTLGQSTSLTLRKLRLYVHRVEVHDGVHDVWHAVSPVLPSNFVGDQGVWLLDFDTLACTRDGTSPEQQQALRFTLPSTKGEHRFDAVRFTLGVPFELNHRDPLQAPPHLAHTSMHWGWQAGYRFFRFDADLSDGRRYAVHLGSTQCHGEVGAITGCDRPNRPSFEVPLKFSSSGQATIALRLQRLLEGVDFKQGEGCMGEVEQGDCRVILKNLEQSAAPEASSDERIFTLKSSPLSSRAMRQKGAMHGGATGGDEGEVIQDDLSLVTTGRALFFDRRLSANEDRSCASCHRPEDGFAGPPSHGSLVAAPSLLGLKWQRRMGRGNPLVRRPEDQVRIALFGSDPVEMGMEDREQELLDRLFEEPRYCGTLFGGRLEGGSCRAGRPEPARHLPRVFSAIADFMRTLEPASCDRESNELVQQGRALFEGDGKCASCHSGVMLSDAYLVDDVARADSSPPPYHRSSSCVDRACATTRLGKGVYASTGHLQDRGKIKTPTLRGVASREYFFVSGEKMSLEEALTRHAPDFEEDEERRRALLAYLAHVSVCGPERVTSSSSRSHASLTR